LGFVAFFFLPSPLSRLHPFYAYHSALSVFCGALLSLVVGDLFLDSTLTLPSVDVVARVIDTRSRRMAHGWRCLFLVLLALVAGLIAASSAEQYVVGKNLGIGFVDEITGYNTRDGSVSIQDLTTETITVNSISVGMRWSTTKPHCRTGHHRHSSCSCAPRAHWFKPYTYSRVFHCATIHH
jgi:hypothetical protein